MNKMGFLGNTLKILTLCHPECDFKGSLYYPDWGA
jgi:hypothetical protein